MTEPLAVLTDLVTRAVKSGAYSCPLPDEGAEIIVLRLLDAEVAVSVVVDGEERVQSAMTFLSKDGNHHSAHLNGWYRPDGFEGSPSEIVDAIWAAFWEHEKENEGLGRILWMHGPTLPLGDDATQTRLAFTVTQVVEESTDLDSFFASLSEPVVEVPRRREEPQACSVFDLFGE